MKQKRRHNPKIVIVCGDGAIRGGYVAGAFYALKKYHPELWAHVTDFTASSASIGGIFYELAYQNEAFAKRLWVEEFSDKRLMNWLNIFLNKELYNIDYLVDIIFKRNNPYQAIGINRLKYGFYFPLIDYETGKTVVFHNRKENISSPNEIEFQPIQEPLVYEYIRAGTAAPILYDKVVTIEGRHFIDGGIRYPFFADESLFKGYKKIIITTQSPSSFGLKFYYTLVGRVYEKFGKFLGAKLHPYTYAEIAKTAEFYAKFAHGLGKIPETLHIYPSQRLGRTFDNSRKTLLKNYEQGERDVLSLSEKIHNFIKS